ncbi:protein KTI12 homolog [Lineus longissimus]|uniref:protein KTI12 homolog n=1 Tax=Lineus longissimus TaxID=88925 RepID=UPI002B4CA3CE
MPFVVITGLPCSGKTTRTEQLKKYLTDQTERTVHLINDESVGCNKNDVYAESRKEKDVRSGLKAAVQRKISKEDVVILDSLNYIKGYRYELFCVTKSAQTPSCVIFCDINVDTANEWNNSRPDADKYAESVFKELVMRYEPPDSRNRWDSPLFTVQQDDELPCQQICDALFRRKAPPPNQSTQSQPLSSTNFLYELDKLTQETVTAILSAQKTSMPGDKILIPGTSEKIDLVRHLTLGELQRIRRQFISYTKMHPVDVGKISGVFVHYINQTIK